mmetsp:Transcript_37166/g.88348  ORF Transcript_37166/g.88348 Transcript_37166/m.88348 type:complete len:221 (+) Transcript_37166:715-1377(+)
MGRFPDTPRIIAKHVHVPAELHHEHEADVGGRDPVHPIREEGRVDELLRPPLLWPQLAALARVRQRPGQDKPLKYRPVVVDLGFNPVAAYQVKQPPWQALPELRVQVVSVGPPEHVDGPVKGRGPDGGAPGRLLGRLSHEGLGGLAVDEADGRLGPNSVLKAGRWSQVETQDGIVSVDHRTQLRPKEPDVVRDHRASSPAIPPRGADARPLVVVAREGVV